MYLLCIYYVFIMYLLCIYYVFVHFVLTIFSLFTVSLYCKWLGYPSLGYISIPSHGMCISLSIDVLYSCAKTDFCIYYNIFDNIFLYF